MSIVLSDRNKQYGNPEDNFRNIKNLWNAYFDAQGFGQHIVSADVPILMALMKIARLATNSTHHDSAVDVAGYMACLADIQEADRNRSTMNQATSQPSQDIPGVSFPNTGK